MIPEWFSILSIIGLVIGIFCAVWIASDVFRHPQHMWIMNIVWPVTALFGTVFTLVLYYRYARLATHEQVRAAKERGEEPPNKAKTPYPAMVAKAASHCGAGCTLGDIAAEFLALAFPVLAVATGWKWLFPAGHEGKIFAVWVLDFILAFVIGVVFQYFTIKPMRNLSVAQGLIQAVKADALSLTAWQVGMYGLMALAQFALFIPVWHAEVTPATAAFWFTMQLAMLAGFATAYPVNWWLIRKGVKEKM